MSRQFEVFPLDIYIQITSRIPYNIHVHHVTGTRFCIRSRILGELVPLCVTKQPTFMKNSRKSCPRTKCQKIYLTFQMYMRIFAK